MKIHPANLLSLGRTTTRDVFEKNQQLNFEVENNNTIMTKYPAKVENKSREYHQVIDIDKRKKRPKKSTEKVESRRSSRLGGDGGIAGTGFQGGLLRVADYMFCLHVVTPLVIAFWRGAWEFMGLYPRIFPNWGIAFIGAVLHFVFALVRDILYEDFDYRSSAEPQRSFLKVFARVYIYIFGWACVTHWRGVWFLLDYLGTDTMTVGTLWLCAIVAMIVTRSLRTTLAPPVIVGVDGPDFWFTFTIMFRTKSVQRPLARHLHPDKHRLLYYVSSRIYTALFGFCCVNSFRGIWKATDLLTGLTPKSVGTFTLVSLVMLAAMKALRNISAPPFVLVTDNHDNYFQVPTMFHTSARKTILYILDCLFSVLVIHTLVVFVWRGLWCMCDLLLFPDRYEWSAWTSLLIGYSITLVAFSLQSCMMELVQKISGFWRVLVVDIYQFISFVATVNVWRGIWNLLNVYFLPQNPVASNWISHLLPFLLLVLLNCANSILVRGVYIDAEEEGGQCVEFPIYYLRLFFQNRRRKKLMRQHTQAKRCSGGSSGGALPQIPRSALLSLENNHHHHQPSPPDSRKGSKEQPCPAHGSHGAGVTGVIGHNLHNQPILVRLQSPFIDIPQSSM